MVEIEQSVLQERYQLALERIKLMRSEETGSQALDAYFHQMAEFVLFMSFVREQLMSGAADHYDLETWKALNRHMYDDILPDHYEKSFANPACAQSELGDEYAKPLCFLYAQLRGLIGYVYDNLMEEIVIHMELLIEVFNTFGQDTPPKTKELNQILYWFVSDYCDVLAAERVLQGIDPARGAAVRILKEADLSDLTYLYRYGEYVTDSELETARYLLTLSEEEIERMARTYTEGYRLGFVYAGKPLEKKKTVNVRYQLGFERMVKKAMEYFRDMGLDIVAFRPAMSVVNRKGVYRIGYTGAQANPQYDYDHREDAALYLDRRFMTRRLEVMKKTYEENLRLANTHAGPAVIETFGEKPFVPAAKSQALSLSEKQRKIMVEMNNEAAQLTNRYIIGEERSFTIIAFPVPEIGPAFKDIFRDTMQINTLDNQLYKEIQQVLIDALDRGTAVHIAGKGENRTDLTVALASLPDPSRQTLFENCLADVNIPVGEVFTSPKLEGTSGILHVTHVYLNGLLYKDLSLTFKDGMIVDYSCGNFKNPEKGRAYIRANILFHHDTLPMGEFAIGTNTAAYRMAEKYQIGAIMPILIAEKTGPHFAVGDTCYSWEEDLPVYNPDGKECIARDNSISALRREDPNRAYFGCHTDITIPYDELGILEVIAADGSRYPLILNGRFVQEGTQALNRALEQNPPETSA